MLKIKDFHKTIPRWSHSIFHNPGPREIYVMQQSTTFDSACPLIVPIDRQGQTNLSVKRASLVEFCTFRRTVDL